MIFGSALSSCFILFLQRHPTSNKPLIDYDVAMLFEPAILLGTVPGVLCNVIFPNWLILVLLIIVSTLTTFRTAWRGITTFKIEKKQQQEENQSIQNIDYSLMPETEKKEGDLRLQALLDEESRTPWFKILVICVSWVIIFVMQLLKGGHGTPSIAGIKACSIEYWVLVTVSFPVIGIIVILCAIYLLLKHKQKLKIGYVFHKGDIHWNLRNTFLYSIFCGFAGFFAG